MLKNYNKKITFANHNYCRGDFFMKNNDKKDKKNKLTLEQSNPLPSPPPLGREQFNEFSPIPLFLIDLIIYLYSYHFSITITTEQG